MAVVLDNGAYTAKIGFCSNEKPKIAPNCVIKAKTVRNRIYIAEQIDDCKDLSGLYYLLAFQKGYLVNWEIEKQVWDYLFGKDGLKLKFNETNIVVTEPYFNFTSIQESMNEMLFEEYDFQGIYRCNAADLAEYKNRYDAKNQMLCCLVVDTGYSFTHIVPFANGKKLKDGIRRVNVGGKILTNHLKEIISYRQLMVMDETYVINQLKEDICYVAEDFQEHVQIARLKLILLLRQRDSFNFNPPGHLLVYAINQKGKQNTVVRDYVLPDYTKVKRGYVKQPEESTGKKNTGDEQIIRMNIERFSVPEVLFRPSDIGIQEMGIPEAITDCVDGFPEEMRCHFYDNIVITGGNCLLPGFRERLYKDLRVLVPDEYDVTIHQSDSPATYAWEGGAQLCKDPKFKKMLVTKQEYEEHGHLISEEKFDV